MVAMLFIQCSKINDEVILEQNYELSKMLGVSDSGLDAKLAEMGFKPYDGQIQYRSLNCFTPGTGCYIQTGGMTTWIQDEHCNGPISITVNYKVALCWDGSLSFYNFSMNQINPCPELQQYMSSLNDHELSAYLDKLYYKASVALEKIWMLTYLQGVSTVSYSYTNQCYQWCFSMDESLGKTVVYRAEKVNCGEHCCIRNTTFYWEGGVLKSSPPVFIEPGPSDCATFPIEECRSARGRFVGDCDHTCGPL